MPESLLSLRNITHSFGHKTVLKNVSCSLEPGKIYALIGPNGAGKTTLFRILTGLITPDSGSVTYNHIDLAQQPVEARKQFTYLSDEPNIYPYLSGEEYLHLTASLRGITEADASERISLLKKSFDQLPDLHEPLGEQSRGNRQKTLFLGALLAKPQVILSDEPIVGLDPTSIQAFGEHLRAFSQEGGCALLALHTLDFAQEFADEVIMLVDGTIVATEAVTKQNLQSIYKAHTAA